MKRAFAQLFHQHKAYYTGFLSKHNCQNIRSTCNAIAVTFQQRVGARTPTTLFAKKCLCASLLPFPVVKAWSVWNKESPEDGAIQKFANTLRLKSKGDTELIKALYGADDLYKNGEMSDYGRVLLLLNPHRHKNEPELEWRLARITYELSKTTSPPDRAGMLEDAFKMVTSALEKDEQNFAVHKWTAILLNEVSILKGLKEQITQSVNVKQHIMRAIELNPTDATSRYMLGNWCFSVAEVPWYQKKVAATLFATPPESTYQEALEHFAIAERIDPDFYSMNTLMLARTYILLGDLNNAAKYLKRLEVRKVKTDEDHMAKLEAVELIKKHFGSQKKFEEAAASIEHVA